jgi:GNAT superfamily N-acetyltransferase
MTSSIDSNLFEFYEYSAGATGRPLVRRNGFSCVDLRPSPWASAVYGLDFTLGEGVLPELLESISSGSFPNKIRVGPGSRPLDIERRLSQAGCLPGRRSCGMTLEMRSRRIVRPPEGLSLETLRGDGDYLDFARIVAVNLFNEREETGVEFSRVIRSIEADRGFGFLGRVGGRAVSTAFAFIDRSGVGGVYFVATEPGQRGRGFGAATVSAALDELEMRGIIGCILHATELGRPVYERLGFLVDCPLAIYSFPK